MINPKEAVERYLAAWNERDPSRRRAMVAKAWTEDANYTDPHRTGDGHEGISAMIATVHERFNDAYRFRLKDGVDGYGDRVRFQWEVGGTKDAPLHFVGTDFAVIANDGRLKTVTGFVDEAPAAPPQN